MSFRSSLGAFLRPRALALAVLAMVCGAGGASSAHAGYSPHGEDADLQPEQLRPCVYFPTLEPPTTVPGCRRNVTPYIWVKAGGSSSWRLDCGGNEPYSWASPVAGGPRGGLPTTGYDYSDSAHSVGRLDIFERFVVGSPGSPGWAVEGVQNYLGLQGHHWDYGIGCSPQQPPWKEATPRPSAPTGVTREIALAPSRLTTVRRSCRPGTRVLHASHGVGWLRKSRNPDDEVQVVHSRRGRTVTWRFLTGHFRRGNVRAQTHLTCSRP